MQDQTLCPVIVGVGRSGTTLLRLMLDAHPDMAIPPETHFVPELAGLSLLEDARGAFTRIATESERWKDFGVSAQELAAALHGPPLDVKDCLRRFYALYARRFNKHRWGEKTPIYIMYMRDIEAVLPEAAFIHIIRDGRDVALSAQGLWFGGDVEKLARRWTDTIRHARTVAATLPRYMELHYEALLADPEAELRRVCAFIGLAYDPAMLRYTETASERIGALQTVRDPAGKVIAAAERRRSIHAMTSSPPDQSRAGRWREHMPATDQRAYEAIAGPLLRELGYETRF